MRHFLAQNAFTFFPFSKVFDGCRNEHSTKYFRLRRTLPPRNVTPLTDISTGRVSTAFEVAFFSQDTDSAMLSRTEGACTSRMLNMHAKLVYEPANRTRATVLFNTVTLSVIFFYFLQSTRLSSAAAAVMLTFAVGTKAFVAVQRVFHVRSSFLHHPTVIVSLGHTFILAGQFCC